MTGKRGILKQGKQGWYDPNPVSKSTKGMFAGELPEPEPMDITEALMLAADALSQHPSNSPEHAARLQEAKRLINRLKWDFINKRVEVKDD